MTSRKRKNNNLQRPVSAIGLMMRPLHLRSYLALALIVAGIAILASASMAQDNVANQEETNNQQTAEKHLAEILSYGDDDGFVYQREGRTDPFLPFITEKMVQAEKSKASEELTGLQRLEPRQLSLVAIVFSADRKIAMAQDPAGMGYVLREGMEVGLSSVVDSIVPNAVIIKQKYTTISGKSRYRTIEMVLKKEGEK